MTEKHWVYLHAALCVLITMTANYSLDWLLKLYEIKPPYMVTFVIMGMFWFFLFKATRRYFYSKAAQANVQNLSSKKN